MRVNFPFTQVTDRGFFELTVRGTGFLPTVAAIGSAVSLTLIVGAENPKP